MNNNINKSLVDPILHTSFFSFPDLLLCLGWIGQTRGWMVVMMEGDRLHKHSCFFFLIDCFQGQKKHRQQKALNEQFYFTYKSLLFEFFFLSNSFQKPYFIYPLKLVIHYTSENKLDFLCWSLLCSRLSLKHWAGTVQRFFLFFAFC